MPTAFETTDWNSYMDSEPTEEEEVPTLRGMPSRQKDSHSLFALPSFLTEDAAALDRNALPDRSGPIADPFPLLRHPVDGLPLALPTTRALRREGLRTLSDLVAMSHNQLAQLPGLDRKALREIEGLLESLELSLAPNLPEQETSPNNVRLPSNATSEREPLSPAEIQPVAMTPQELPTPIGATVAITQLDLPLETVSYGTRRCRVCRRLFLPAQDEQQHCSAVCDESAPQRTKRKRLPATSPENGDNQICLDL